LQGYGLVCLDFKLPLRATLTGDDWGSNYRCDFTSSEIGEKKVAKITGLGALNASNIKQND